MRCPCTEVFEWIMWDTDGSVPVGEFTNYPLGLTLEELVRFTKRAREWTYSGDFTDWSITATAGTVEASVLGEPYSRTTKNIFEGNEEWKMVIECESRTDPVDNAGGGNDEESTANDSASVSLGYAVTFIVACSSVTPIIFRNDLYYPYMLISVSAGYTGIATHLDPENPEGDGFATASLSIGGGSNDTYFDNDGTITVNVDGHGVTVGFTITESEDQTGTGAEVNPTGGILPTITILPTKFWPYTLDNGNPAWDESSGQPLILQF